MDHDRPAPPKENEDQKPESAIPEGHKFVRSTRAINVSFLLASLGAIATYFPIWNDVAKVFGNLDERALSVVRLTMIMSAFYFAVWGYLLTGKFPFETWRKFMELSVTSIRGPDMPVQVNSSISTNHSRVENLADEIIDDVSDDKKNFRELFRRLDASIHRLKKEIAMISRRSNINLMIGTGTALTGIGLISYVYFTDPMNQTDLFSLLAHGIPRITLVVVVELFAYYFLNLYKSNLSEIKYFQNELTNIESRQIALVLALVSKSKKTTQMVATAFCGTDRNQVLNKDQTTVELEKAKIQNEVTANFTKPILELLNKKAS